MSIDLNAILNTNDPKQISPFITNSFLYKSDDIIEKVIKICYNKVSDYTFKNFLLYAVISDKVNVFQIMDTLGYSYDKVKIIEMTNTYNSIKCNNYFKLKI